MSDPINPPHYKQGDVECIQAIQSALGSMEFVHFLRGQIIKYAWRFMLKGEMLENAHKLQWYAGRLADEVELMRVVEQADVCQINANRALSADMSDEENKEAIKSGFQL